MKFSINSTPSAMLIHERRCLLPRPPIDFQDFTDLSGMALSVSLHRFTNYTMNFAKSYPAAQKSGHRNFVRTVENRRHSTTLAQRLIAKRQSRKPPLFDR